MNTKSLALVSIVDDDESVRESLPDLLKQFGFSTVAFSSAEQFLSSGYADQTGCLLLDFAMPGMSGRELMRELSARGYAIPIVFITAQGEEALRVALLNEGATACLFKPFSAAELMQALQSAFSGASGPES